MKMIYHNYRFCVAPRRKGGAASRTLHYIINDKQSTYNIIQHIIIIIIIFIKLHCNSIRSYTITF